MDDTCSGRTRSTDRGNPGTEGPEAEGDPGELACLFLTAARSRYSQWPRICSETAAPVTCVVLGVFEARVRRAESRERDPGEPEANGPKGGCLQNTPEIINACSFQRSNGSFRWKPRQRTIQMETETHGPFRWIPSFRISKNDRRSLDPPLRPPIPRKPILTTTVNHPVLTLTFTTKPTVHRSTGYSRCPTATQVPTLTVVRRTVCVCVGE